MVTRPRLLLARPTQALRAQKVSAPKRPEAPVSARRNECIANTADRPPPRSSVPLKPIQLVVIWPLSTFQVFWPPAGLVWPTLRSIRPDRSEERRGGEEGRSRGAPDH